MVAWAVEASAPSSASRGTRSAAVSAENSAPHSRAQ